MLKLGPVLLALALGGAGGYVFLLAHVPLAWMLGAMTVTMVAAVLGLPVRGPEPLRGPTVAVLGVLLGSGFSPDFVAEAARWPLTIAGLFLFVAISGFGAVLFLRKAGGYDRPTAYFAGMPGGLTEMIIAGMENGGDPRRIGLCHAARIFLVVLSIPALLALFGHDVSTAGRMEGAPGILDTDAVSILWLVGCAVVGMFIGRLLRLPAAPFLGPMIASALIHAMGWSDFRTPGELVIVAQLVLGTIVGCRFVGATPREVGTILLLSVGSTGIILIVTVLFALGLGAISGRGFAPLLVAYSPGGLVEMNLIALALGIETSFVAVHHVVRVVLVMFSAPILFRLLKRWRPG